jgi:hypothetical protein
MKIPRALAIVAAALLLPWLHGCASGLQGGTFESAGGPTIANVSLSFVKEDGSASFGTTSNASGRYSIALSPGRYYLLAQHTGHEDYNSAPGFGVVNADTMGVANFFLRPPQVTTVIIVRHGEKQDPNSNLPTEPLSAAGQARAQALRETLLRAGITAVYSTDTTRTPHLRPWPPTFSPSTRATWCWLPRTATRPMTWPMPSALRSPPTAFPTSTTCTW